MNAVRIRKENQVISAEEKRALMLFKYVVKNFISIPLYTLS